MTPRHRTQLSQLAQYRLSLPDRPSQGWVADQLSDLLGEDVSQQAVGYWETGKVNLQKVHPRRLRAYASVLKISLEQLAQAVNLTAKDLFSDTALQTEQFFDEMSRHDMTLEISREDLANLGYAKPQSQLSPGHQMISPDKVLIPIYGTATAGCPADFLSEGNIMNYAVIDQAQFRNGNTIAITVSGMSMQPTFTDSETVLIDKSLTDLEDRGVYLICVEGQGVCLKRARLRRGAWWLTSDNPDHDDFQADEATVIGRVYFAQPAGRTVS